METELAGSANNQSEQKPDMLANEEQVLTPGGYRAKSQVHEAGASDPATQEEHVLTPGGYRPKSQVHFIEAEHSLNVAEGRLLKLHPQGGIAADFGLVPKKPGDEPLMPANVFVPANKTIPAFGSGWITYTGWTNNTGTPLSSFSTTWVVPPAPATQSGQTIFLFNGIQNSTMIYQPVLQWGSSAAGGGNYWSIASWYVDGQGGVAFHSSLIKVNPGDVLTGVMELTGQSKNLFNYNCYFKGIANSGYAITNVEQLTWCIETLEAYSITKASDYPATTGTVFKSISIKTGTTNPAIVWTAYTPVTDCGQHATVISNSATNGEIDLFYRGITMAWRGINDQGVYFSSFGGANWVPQQSIGGIGSSVGPSLALFSGRIYMAWKGINADQGIYFSSFDGSDWIPQKNIAGIATSWRPSLAVFNGKLFMAWKGMNADQGIYFSSFDGTNWAPQKNVAGIGTSYGPALATYSGLLYMSWKGINNDSGIYYSTFNGAVWAAQQNIPGVGTSVCTGLAAL